MTESPQRDLTPLEQTLLDRGTHPANISCPPGWQPLVSGLIAKLDEQVPGWSPVQVKQKFGGLRFYYEVPESVLDELRGQVRALVDETERASATLCEECGSPGKLRKKGYWLFVACDDHASDSAVVVPADED